MKVDVRITYEGANDEIDKKIGTLMEEIDGKMYASGFNCRTNVRDICFDLEVK